MTHNQSQPDAFDLPLDDILQPIASASGLPNLAYTDTVFSTYERDHVLGKSWAGLWFASDLPNNGYVKPVEFMGPAAGDHAQQAG